MLCHFLVSSSHSLLDLPLHYYDCSFHASIRTENLFFFVPSADIS